MCGRFGLYDEPEVIEALFDVELSTYQPRDDIRPTDPVLVILGEQPDARNMRWSLVPSWEKTSKIKYSTFNVRIEDVSEKPAFRTSWEEGRRCIVPASVFYEWKELPGNTKKPKKQKHLFRLKNKSVMPLAGIWDEWKSKSGEILQSCTILTTVGNEIVQPIHAKNRMPVILTEEMISRWLNPVLSSEEASMNLKPFASAQMEALACEPNEKSDEQGELMLF